MLVQLLVDARACISLGQHARLWSAYLAPNCHMSLLWSDLWLNIETHHVEVYFLTFTLRQTLHFVTARKICRCLFVKVLDLYWGDVLEDGRLMRHL